MLRIVGDETDLSPERQAIISARGATGKIGGFWDGKRITLVADNIAPGAETGVLLHEALHSAQGPLSRSRYRDMVGTRFDDLSGRFNELLKGGDPIAVAAERRAQKSGETGMRLRAERQAYFLEEWLNHGKPTRGKAADLAHGIMTALRAWVFKSPAYGALKKHGIEFKLQPEDFVALAKQGLQTRIKAVHGRQEPSPVGVAGKLARAPGQPGLNAENSRAGIARRPLFSQSTLADATSEKYANNRAAIEHMLRAVPARLPELDTARHPVPTNDIELALHVLRNDKSLDLLDALAYLKGAIKAGVSAKDNKLFADYIEQENLPPGQRTITLSAREQRLFDTYIRPLREAMEHSEGYIPREAKGKGGKLDRLVKGAGKFGVGTLRKSLGSQKHRVFRAVADEGGNRHIVAVKRNGNKLHLVGFKDKQAYPFGTITRTDSDAELEKALAPLKKKLAALHKEKALLTASTSRANASRRRIANIDNEISEVLAQEEGIRGEDHAINGTFHARNGKRYRIGEATTNEIERHTRVRYHHNLLGKLLDEYVSIRQTERQTQFLDDLKESDEFKAIATQDFATAPPKWRPVNLPQFHGYLIEPYTAEVLNHYAAKMRVERRIPYLSASNNLLRKAMFSILPLWHDFNLTDSALVQRGISGIMPIGMYRLARTLGPAVHEVVTLGPKYQRLMEKGAPFMHANSMLGMVTPEAYADIVTSLGRELDEKPELHPIAKSLGYVPGQAGKALKWWSRHAQESIWTFNDVIAMQAIMERERQGLSEDEALKRVFEILPNYRLPEGSKLLNVVTHPDVSWFARYHLGLFRSYGHMMKRLLGRHQRLKDRAHAADQLAMVGLMSLVVYPLLDAVVQKESDNEKAHVTRFGLSTVPYDLYKMTKGQMSLIHFFVKQFTPAPGTYEVLQQAFNTDFWSHDPIAPWYDSSWEATTDRLKHLSDTNIPLQNFLGGSTPTQGLLAQIGVHIPPTKMQRIRKKSEENRVMTEREHEHFKEAGKR